MTKLVLLAMLIVLAGCATFVESMKPTDGYINVKSVNLTTNTTARASVVKALQFGDIVTVIGRASDYYLIQVQGNEGFVEIKSVVISKNPPDLKAMKQQMTEVLDQPTTFSLPISKAEAAWSRAGIFIAEHSSMKLELATENVLQTYNAIERGKYSYIITRGKIDDSVRFVVSSNSDLNAHICAAHIITGKDYSLILEK